MSCVFIYWINFVKAHIILLKMPLCLEPFGAECYAFLTHSVVMLNILNIIQVWLLLCSPHINCVLLQIIPSIYLCGLISFTSTVTFLFTINSQRYIETLIALKRRIERIGIRNETLFQHDNAGPHTITVHHL